MEQNKEYKKINYLIDTANILLSFAIFFGVIYFAVNYYWPKISYDLLDNLDYEIGSKSLIMNDHEYKETFICNNTGAIEKIGFRTITWQKTYKPQNLLFIEISDKNKNVLLSESIDCTNFTDRMVYYHYFETKIKLKKNKKYMLTFRTNMTNEDDSLALMQDANGNIAVSLW